MSTIALLSGPIASGKSSIASALVEKYAFQRIRTSVYLAERAAYLQLPTDRTGLQELGDRLDRESDHRWVIDEVIAPTLKSSTHCNRYLLDSIRKTEQATRLREEFGHSVFHVHIHAKEEILLARYTHRESSSHSGQAFYVNYQIATSHPNEIAARSLIQIADLSIDVSTLSAEQASDVIFSACLVRELHS